MLRGGRRVNSPIGNLFYSKYFYLCDAARVLIKDELLTMTNADTIKVGHEYFRESAKHMNVTSVKTSSSKGEIAFDRFKYADDYNYHPAALETWILDMVDNRIKNVPIETTHSFSRNGKEYTVSGKIVTYAMSGQNILRPRSVYELITGAPVPDFRMSSLEPTYFKMDGSYVLQKSFEAYDTSGNLLESRDRIGQSTSYIWENGRKVPKAIAVDAKRNEIAFTDFEDRLKQEGGWQYSINSLYRNENGPLPGEYVFDLYTGVNQTLSLPGLDPQKKYILQYWTDSYAPASVVGFPVNTYVTLRKLGGWTLFSHTISGGSTLKLQSSAEPIFIDGVSLSPVNSQMHKYTNDWKWGTTSRTDERGMTQFYLYDGFGRLKSILDQNKNVVNDYQYNYRP